ncbi:hypothetical protein L2725_18450 [Shewanella corallii]|uniref:Uncharacterized protein n=1 Tax=Shewanella corallii TaxID=560080 RepID=A0ABT0NBD7_9GAMM|nr:hypothetical protein [Shewanella corallii]MCL2915739.1 hypothetical protein [Shewanella corallii]
MKGKSFTVELKCFFCDCSLEGVAEKEYVSGDMLECQNCHDLNDYDALIDVAAEEGKNLVADYAQQEIEKMLKKAFKK